MRCSSAAALPLICRFDLIQQEPARQKTVEPLRAFFLTLDPNPAGPMMQHYAARNFIDVLPARARGADELLVDVLFANAQGLHAREQLLFFVGGNREKCHG